jgi:hypothetical protein
MIYRIRDTYGTDRRTWTRSAALAWLACCSPDAAITRFGRLVAARRQHNRQQ